MNYTHPIIATSYILHAISDQPVLFMFDSDMTLVDWVSPHQIREADPPQETKTHLHELHALEDVFVSFNTGRDEPYMHTTYQAPFPGAFAHGQYLRKEFGHAVEQVFPLPDFSELDKIINSAIAHRTDLKVEHTKEKRVIHFSDSLTDEEAVRIHAHLTQLIETSNLLTDEPLGILTGNRIFEIGHVEAGKGPATLTLRQHYPDHITLSAGDTFTDIDMLNHSDIAILIGDMIPDEAISGPSTTIRLKTPEDMRKVVQSLHLHLSLDMERRADLQALNIEF